MVLSFKRNKNYLDPFHVKISQCFCFYFRSGDSTARIWKIAEGPYNTSVLNEPVNVVVLRHFKGRTNEKSKDVTTLDWNVSLFRSVLTILLSLFRNLAIGISSLYLSCIFYLNTFNPFLSFCLSYVSTMLSFT